MVERLHSPQQVLVAGVSIFIDDVVYKVASKEAEGINDAVIMTSVNKKGFFMNPSRAACEEILQNPGLEIMAMSILASGAISAEEAFRYAASFPAVKCLLFGASRDETLGKSLEIIKSIRES